MTNCARCCMWLEDAGSDGWLDGCNHETDVSCTGLTRLRSGDLITKQVTYGRGVVVHPPLTL